MQERRLSSASFLQGGTARRSENSTDEDLTRRKKKQRQPALSLAKETSPRDDHDTKNTKQATNKKEKRNKREGGRFEGRQTDEEASVSIMKD